MPILVSLATRKAGTGKSTLIRFIIDALDLQNVCYIAYTGKAAQVLRSKGCANAMTAHRLLYQSVRKKNGTYFHKPHESIYPYDLIVVDEISMLPRPMWELLLSHNRPIIALGDPYQLPPVLAEDNRVLERPHVFLDEIMRQAAESEIIRLTLDIRQGNPLRYCRGQEVRVVGRQELNKPGFLAWGDQIICGKNKTRHTINNLMRKIRLNTDDPNPVIGDRLICLRNEWGCATENGEALVNGSSGIITDLKFTKDNPFMERTPIISFKPDSVSGDVFENLEIDYKILTEHETTITRDNFRHIPEYYHPKEFDYGYCITCHKSQGSEYNKVIVLEEYLRGEDKEAHSRWLYTAATRAAQKLIIVKGY